MLEPLSPCKLASMVFACTPVLSKKERFAAPLRASTATQSMDAGSLDVARRFISHAQLRLIRSGHHHSLCSRP